MALLSDYVGYILNNGNKGDITISGSGDTWTVNNGAISYGKIQNVSASSRLLGRSSAGAGSIEEISLGSGLSLSGGVLGSSVSWAKEPVRAATTANITLSGTQTIDGVALVAGDRVLVKNQSTSANNGIYVVASGTWTRASDADTAAKMAGAVVAVLAGTTNGGLLFDTDFKSTNTLGSTAVTFSRVYDTSAASSSNTGGTLVLRNSSGNFSAGTITASLDGNADTATTLQTARTINGTSFNGSSNITTANWGISRTITIGNTAKAVNGSADVSWGISEIFPANVSGNWWNDGPVIVGSDGVSEIGRYLDFHSSDTGTTDSDVRIECTGSNAITFGPSTTVSAGTFSGALSGNATTATTLQTARTINGVSFNGSANITLTANTPNSLTFNNGGTGAASGTTFDGGTARTISYNTLGAAASNGSNATGTWGISISGNAATVTNGVYTDTTQTITGVKTFSGGLNSTRIVNIRASSGFSSLRVGDLAASNTFSYIDLVAASGQDYGLRISRGNTGVNAITAFEHIGTGTFRLLTTNAADITLETFGSVRGRVTSGGEFRWATSTTLFPFTSTSNTGFEILGSGILGISQTGGSCIYLRRTSSDGIVQEFYRGTSYVGGINITTTGTTYTTISDYRLKENINEIDNPVTIIQQLKPCEFNFKAEPDKKVTGFLAHEVADIVPEAVTGSKDAVDVEGKPVYQSLDASRLVPILTAALQEALLKIENLEARLEAAGL